MLILFVMINEYKSFYKTVNGNEGTKCNYATRLDPYGKGCYYNCKYCYAKSLLNFRKLWHPENVAQADIQKIRKKIDKLEEGTVIRLGGMTDCFQPIEKKVKNTLNTIKALNHKKIHYLIVTKSDLLLNKEYMEILDKELAHVQISIPSTENNILSQLDNAPPFERRKETVETLHSEGYDTCIRLSPFLPEHTDIHKINRIQCDKVLVEFLRVNSWIEKAIKDIVDISEYTVKQSNYKHLPLNKKLELLKQIKKPQVSVCDDVDEHYMYFKNNFNPNPQDCCNLTFKKPSYIMEENIIDSATFM